MTNRSCELHNIVLFAVAILCMSANCVQNTSKNIRQIGVYNLTIPEPSGLALDIDNEQLFIVSDRKGQIYITSLQGVVQNKIDIKRSDFEGIAWNKTSDHFYVVDESKNKVNVYNRTGDKVASHKLPRDASEKSGPEGITINPTTGDVYVVNEKSPQLLYHLDSDFNEISTTAIDFLSDVSAVEVNPTNGALWLMSDEDQRVVRLGADGRPEEVYLIDVIQMEGLAIDFDKKHMYIVSDKEQELHIYAYE